MIPSGSPIISFFLIAVIPLAIHGKERKLRAGIQSFDVVVVGGTPAGIMSAIAAAKRGRSVALIERARHIGGLPANGLGATDIRTRGASGELFLEFVNRIKGYYVRTFGADSPQARASSDGYRFEPSVAERVLGEMLAEHPRIKVMLMRQFDALPDSVMLDGARVSRIKIKSRENNSIDEIGGKVFIDATYEGDLAAAAGVPYRIGREAKDQFNEPMAGKLYRNGAGPSDQVRPA